MTISSPDASKLSISGAGAFSILDIDGGGDDGSDSLLQVTIAGLTFTDADGNAIDNHENTTLANVIISGNSGSSAIDNEADLSILDSTISGNTNLDQSRGGGIYNTGSLKLMNCTVSGNTSSLGGGIANLGALTIANSTIAGNSVTPSDNYPGQGGGIFNSGALSVTNTTISCNSAATGGGIFTKSGGTPANLSNTIVAGNTATDLTADVNGPVAGGYNLIGDGTGMTSNGYGDSGHNQVGTSSNPIDPKLGPLADNGGPTQTMALLSNSPAINAGDNDFRPSM